MIITTERIDNVKRKIVVLVSMICVMVIVVLATSAVSVAGEEKIAKLGEYEITENELKTYLGLSWVQDPAATYEDAARIYVKAKIAAEEISGTHYDIPKSYKRELLNAEKENFDRDYETNIALCRANGISREEMIDMVVTSKLNIYIEGQHFSKVMDEYIQREKELKKNKAYSADELLEIYNGYMTDKLSGLKFVALNSDKLKTIGSMSAFSFATEETIIER